MKSTHFMACKSADIIDIYKLYITDKNSNLIGKKKKKTGKARRHFSKPKQKFALRISPVYKNISRNCEILNQNKEKKRDRKTTRKVNKIKKKLSHRLVLHNKLHNVLSNVAFWTRCFLLAWGLQRGSWSRFSDSTWTWTWLGLLTRL